ncbi:site-specific DNA-methyltransferase [Streptomyces sp. NPDC057651]|uniref:site-specific DNA-methyltransferase n=1 Tax=Streptomyces sp. NPDC057651 TaxID=3346194 RepID=UPI00369F9CE8
MPPRKKQTGSTPVESITHGDKRANLPTADAQEFVTPAVEEARRIFVQRDTSLDPQLMWKGKYGDETTEAIEAAAEMVSDAPPIYIQEKIDPRVLIENLRNTTARPESEADLTLFDSFDGLDELDLVDFYEHQANWSNRMILGDGLQVMASLVEREELRGQVQMVYIDPPYGIRFESNWQATARSRSVKDGKVEDVVREAEQIKAFRDTWDLGIHSYLSYLRDRLLVARELLTESGSCFVQIGSANLHLVTTLMAEVFGPENHVETIAFRKKTMPLGGRLLEGAYDYIVWFAKDKELVKYRRLFQSQNIQGDSHWNVAVEPDGSKRTMTRAEIDAHQLLPAGTDIAQLIGLYPVGAFDTGIYDYEFGGRTYKLPPGKSWPSPKPGMDRLALAGRLQPYDDGKTLRYVLRHSDYPVTVYNNVWTDTSAATGMSYVVETSPKVIQRCMLMCTDPGDLVLDPTCGSGTTAYVAEQWGRRWITIDTSRVALALARQRLMGAKYPFYLLADSAKGRIAEGKASGATLPSTRVTNDIRHGFVYERVRHITLKSIANNPDIHEGMERGEIDRAIERHADSEVLYDRPYEDKSTVRVTGPFTVESLSPHRSLAFAGGPDAAHRESISEMSGAEQPDAPNFEQSILANLGRAGVQNGRRGERIEFASIDSYPGTYIQAVGTSTSLSGGGEARIGIAIGPQYGTVSQRFARDAVKEAISARDIDLLCLLGFAFDASTGEVTEADGITVDTSADGFAQVEGERSFGRIKLLMVRMNVDLLMGEDLKKTGAGNLFTVFGEPDIDVRHDDGDVVVELKGVDVYDPTTNEVRSNDTRLVALWMIDTNYNGDSFFVRHCYFTGGGDPYKRLKSALKAEIDVDAWASLNSTVSRPFAKPDTGRIAIKVINDYGDEVMKVFQV